MIFCNIVGLSIKYKLKNLKAASVSMFDENFKNCKHINDIIRSVGR